MRTKTPRIGLLLLGASLCLGWVHPRQVLAPAPEWRTQRDAQGRDVPEGRYLDLARSTSVLEEGLYHPAPAPWQREWPQLASPPDPGRYVDLGARLERQR